MKRLGTMFVLIVALGLAAASSAVAATPNPWKETGAPTNASWTGVPTSSKTWNTKAWDVRRPSDVRQGARGWDVRNPSRANPSDVRQGTRTWARFAPRSWSDGSRPS